MVCLPLRVCAFMCMRMCAFSLSRGVGRTGKRTYPCVESLFAEAICSVRVRVLLDPCRTFSFQTGGSGPYGRANTDRDEEESFGSDDDEGEVLQRL
jgi:hypothetical protein